MIPLGNDRWQAVFRPDVVGRYEYTVVAWVDRFLSWRHDIARRQDAEDIRVALQVGVELIKATVVRATGNDVHALNEWAAKLAAAMTPEFGRELAQNEHLATLMGTHGERHFFSEYDRVLEVVVDVDQARFSTWYELFPRSCTDQDKPHGNFAGVISRLPDVAAMGFDVLYLPPIHPIGKTFRKGPNNSLGGRRRRSRQPVGDRRAEGGHNAIHPQLGTLDDFRRLVGEARKHGIEIALDIAFQCSPDHPYVREHPEWFRHRPDGTFSTPRTHPRNIRTSIHSISRARDWRELWEELQGRLRVLGRPGRAHLSRRQPAHQAVPVLGMVIGAIKREHPDVIFLAEAFTRPKIMYRLAKLGFTQSYTYFAWRNTKQELTEYFTELAQHRSARFFRPNCGRTRPTS